VANFSNYDKKLLEEGYIIFDKTSENVHFPGLDDIRGFQQQKNKKHKHTLVKNLGKQKRIWLWHLILG
jgi:hypothetical protein